MSVLACDRHDCTNIDNLLLGYHYTSYSNWKYIQEIGLLPTPVSDEKLRVIRKYPLPAWNGTGVWVWPDRLGPNAHAGSILFQVATKATPRVVLLQLKYDVKDLLRDEEGAIVALHHDGSLGNWAYHDKELAFLVIVPIPANNIELVESYDVVKALQPFSPTHM